VKKIARADELASLRLALGVPPGSIEQQEERGQRELVESMQLPADGIEACTWAEVTGELDDPLFVPVKLPDGWTKVPNPDNSFWSHVLDDKGRIRAKAFYKASGYDRRARIHPTRWAIAERDDNRQDAAVFRAKTADGGWLYKVVLTYDPEMTAVEKWGVMNEAEALVWAWLDKHYPDHDDVSAYW
jgi:hypothetical protein